MLRKTDYNEPHLLDLNNMNNLMKMNRLNTQGMIKREKTPEVLMTKQEIKKAIDIDDDRPDVIGDKYRKAAGLQIQANKITLNSIVDDLGFRPMKIKSAVTQKMIDEHRAEQQKPVLVNGTYFKYHPSTVDTTLEQPNLRIPRTAATLKLVQDHKIALAAEYATIQARIAAAGGGGGGGGGGAIDFKVLFNRISNATIDQQTTIANELGIKLTPWAMGNKKAGIVAYTKDHRKADLNKYVSDLQTARLAGPVNFDADRQRLLEIAGEIDLIDITLASEVNIPSENRIEQARVDKINKSKLNEAYSELKTLNSGFMAPDQQPGETDDDFRLRLIAVGIEEQDDDIVQSNANLVNIVRAKGNLKDILSDEGIISTVIKKLDKDEVFVMNKKWEAIKKKFLETYGFNNNQVSDQDIVDFVRQMLNYMGGEIVTNPAKVAAGEGGGGGGGGGAPVIVAIDEIAKKLTTYDVIDASKFLNFPKQSKRIAVEELIKAGHTTAEEIKSLAQQYRSRPKPVAGVRGPLGPGGGAGAAEEPAVVGAGIHLPDYPRYIKLGAIHIEPAPLFYDNILKIRGNKGKNGEHYRFVGINDVKVSDVLRSIIIKLTNGETITKYDTNMLNSHDKVIYDNLMIVSKLHKSHESSVDETARNLKTRFEIIEGEIEAGNNNPKLLKELYDILHQMSHHKIISKADARRYWEEFNN